MVMALSMAIVAGCGLTGRQRTPSASSDALPLLDPAQITRGRQAYVQYCARCHGTNAEGAPHWLVPDARGDMPAPPHDDNGHTWRHSDRQLIEIIRDGLRDPFNKTPELTMPPFRTELTDAQIRDVIAYFKSLWSAEHRRYQEDQNHRPAMP
jgi:mono/diheme cytochrome c family protein